MLRNILLGLGVFAALLSILIFSKPEIFGLGKSKGPQGEVVLWGTLPETEMNNVVQAFNPQSRTYTVRYKYIPERDFNQRLLEGLASGTGPDLIMTQYQTILSQAERIYPYPVASFGEKAFKDTYVDGSSVLFTPSGALALPVSVEPMVLFYNRSLLSKHGVVNPPSSWAEVEEITPALTLRDKGSFLESAIALGTSDVSYAKDIIMTFVAQQGQIPVVRVPTQLGDSTIFRILVNEPVVEGSDVLPLVSASRYFAQFGDPGQRTYTWSQDQVGDASDVFIAEKLAMYIGYSGEFSTLRTRNPRAEFEMTFLPQLKELNTFTTGMRMYAIATLKSSKNPSAAFTVESQFAGSGVSPTIAAITGGVPALRMYAGTQGLDPVVAQSMLVARGWYDAYPVESSTYMSSLISDIINHRMGVNDAVTIFVGRLRDLYTKQ